MARNLRTVHPDFDTNLFCERTVTELDLLELKQRAQLIADSLHQHLPKDYEEAIAVLIALMKIPLDTSDQLGRYSEFYFLPVAEYIHAYGKNHFEQSMRANYELTKVFTAEFSVRVFIEQYPEKSLGLLKKWARDPNHHVRRLVSEGTRTRLPWAGRLRIFQENPAPVIELLEMLKSDPDLYVRRSVANNLNDIAKDNPGLVIDTLTRWQSSNNRDSNTDWIIKHASRTLIKNGYSEALKLQGFDPNAEIALHNLKLTKTLRFGEKLNFDFTLKNDDDADHNLVVDFVVYFKKANGALAPKVFKLRELKLKAGEEVHISKSHPIKPITTRKYYNGKQALAIQVNGKEYEKESFAINGV